VYVDIKMRDVQLKRIIQAMALAAAALYCTLLLYQNVSGTSMSGEVSFLSFFFTVSLF